jgi:2'-hydroxyisoflavone reductase
MRLLVIGGTKFLGRAVVAAALARGHAVTLFHRGRTNPDLFLEAERVIGDRDGGLDALGKRTWDAVIDPSGYVPRVVRASAERLRDAAGHYQFVSSISVYARFDRPGLGEDAPLRELADPATEDVMPNYGGLKALCERAAADAFGAERVAIVRPGLIVGPHDPSGRFPWWVWRSGRGGAMVAPAPPSRPVQLVDARDLGAWMVRLAEERRAGTYNATSPPFSFAAMLEACRADQPVWIDEARLLAAGVAPWMDLPLWIPRGDPEHEHMLEVDVSRAVAAGLTFRPLADTALDTLRWIREVREFPREYGPVGLDLEREARLLAEAGA